MLGILVIVLGAQPTVLDSQLMVDVTTGIIYDMQVVAETKVIMTTVVLTHEHGHMTISVMRPVRTYRTVTRPIGYAPAIRRQYLQTMRTAAHAAIQRVAQPLSGTPISRWTSVPVARNCQ